MKVKLLILGSKEYPLGTSDDPLRSGGFEIYTENLVENLKNRVERILIITRMFGDTYSYEKIVNIEVYRVPWIRGFYLRNPSFNLTAFFKALTLDFDIILAHGPTSSLLGTFLAFIKKKKVISRPAGIAYVQPQYGRIAKSLIYLLEKTAYKKADEVVFLSEAEKNQFRRKLGHLPKRYVVIPTGVKTPKSKKMDFKKIKKEFNIGDDVVITFVGRLIGVKGIDIFIEGLSQLKGDFKALIVGDGPDLQKLQGKVKEYGLIDEVIFTGWRTDIPEVLAATDIFVLPSYSEGLPIALLEAMASGKACVSADIGLPLEHGADAILFKPGDSLELTKALNTLLFDKELREKLGKNARKKAEKEFSWEKAVESYLRLFNDLLT
jgi:glycosyltransferase involved in cell wall biosynthesis